MVKRACVVCGTVFDGNTNARYCGDRCRKRGSRAGLKLGRKADVVPLKKRDPEPEPPVTPPEPEIGDVERLTRRDLETAGKLDTPAGAAIIALARRLDNPRADTGSAISAVAARWDEMLTKATRGLVGKTAPDLLEDELAARRAGKGAS